MSVLGTLLTRAKFKIRKSNDGQYYWSFVAPNGETLCHSETYTTKQSAENGIRSLKENIDAAIDDLA